MGQLWQVWEELCQFCWPPQVCTCACLGHHSLQVLFPGASCLWPPCCVQKAYWPSPSCTRQVRVQDALSCKRVWDGGLIQGVWCRCILSSGEPQDWFSEYSEFLKETNVAEAGAEWPVTCKMKHIATGVLPPNHCQKAATIKAAPHGSQDKESDDSVSG